jgi:deoxyribonuclease-1
MQTNVLSALFTLLRRLPLPRWLMAVVLAVAGLLMFGGDFFHSKPPSPPPVADVSLTDLPKTPKSFSQAKKLLYTEVYKGHPYTFYCHCKFDSKRKVDLTGCNVQARSNEKRAQQLEAEHVFPAYHFGQQRACWREPLCTNKKGEKFKGRECCEEMDTVFRTAHNDLHNLYPAVGEINGDRSNYSWGMIEGEKKEYGRCDIEVDSTNRRAEPPENVRGDIARTYFYMAKTYRLSISDQEKQLFSAWDKLDPADDWERERNQRIEKIQGNRNPFIQ